VLATDPGPSGLPNLAIKIGIIVRFVTMWMRVAAVVRGFSDPAMACPLLVAGCGFVSQLG